MDTEDGAAVRIAMTVGVAGTKAGELLEVIDEKQLKDGSEDVTFQSSFGMISDDLTIRGSLSSSTPLRANEAITSMGVMLAGRGFVVDEPTARNLGAGKKGLETVLRPIRNGKDLLDEPRMMYAIDFTGFSLDRAREAHPTLFQILLTHAKPERERNRDRQFQERWWLFGRSRPEFRAMTQGLSRYIATVETAKHRVFEFLDSNILPEHSLIVFGTDDAFFLGILSSRIHVEYALAAGGTLEDRPRYNKSRCFDPFPFPICGEKEKDVIRKLAEEIDSHRKRAQENHSLTLTGMYNVVEKLRVGQTLKEKEKAIHEKGLVSVLKQLHDDLDAAVFAAYGWPASLSDAEILERLVALNAERAAEEKRGVIHWLRPEYQIKALGYGKDSQSALNLPEEEKKPKGKPEKKQPKGAARKNEWPATLPARVQAVEAALHRAGAPITADELAKQFARAKPAAVSEILETLLAMGRAHKKGSTYTR